MKNNIYITIFALLFAGPVVGLAQTEEQNVAEALQSDINNRQKGHLVMARLIKACGLMDALSQTEDMEYYEKRASGALQNLPNHNTEARPGYLPEHRYIGYTIFSEPDTYWEGVIGKDATQISAADVQTYLRGMGMTGYANTNYTSADNMLYKFVTYHLLPERIRPEGLVIHFNELWYNLMTMQKQASVFEYFTTMGERRLLKTYEASRTCKGDTNVVYLNRFPILDNGRHGRYTETGCDAGKEGVQITDTTLYSNAYIYTLGGMLAYTSDVENNLAAERIRMDFTSFMPEMMTNDIRCNENPTNQDLCKGFPVDNDYRYLENCRIGQNTRLYYLTGRESRTTSWHNYQGDEFNAIGLYDVTFTLPPVPKAGTYEIRIGQSASAQRGICLIDFGTDPDNMKPVGLPFDLRKGGMNWFMSSNQTIDSGIGMEDDVEGDDMTNMENDLMIHQKGYMKAPNSYYRIGQSNTMRDEIETKGSWSIVRRIVYTGYMEPDQTYYLRFTNATDDESYQLYLDYLEYCPQSIYDSEEKEEDIW